MINIKSTNICMLDFWHVQYNVDVSLFTLQKFWTWSNSAKLTPLENPADLKADSSLSAIVGAVPNQGCSNPILCSCYLVVWLAVC